jgi:hypothetical protein
MSERLILVAGLLLVCGGGLWLARRLSPLHPLVFALGWTLVLGSFYPLTTLFVEPSSWRNLGDLSEEVLLSVTGDYLAFGLGLLLAVLWFWSPGGLAAPRSAAKSPARARERWRDRLVAWGLLAAGLLLYSVYVRRVGLEPLLDRHDYAEKYRASEGLGPFLFGLNLVICACLWAEASFERGRARLLFRCLSLIVVVWALALISVRAYAIAVILGHLVLFCDRRGVQLRRVRPLVLAAVLAVYAGVETYGHLRGSWRGSAADLLASVQDLGQASKATLGQIVGGSELSHPFISAMEIAQFEEPGELRGRSYVNELWTVVPLAFHPDRERTVAQLFVAEYYPAVSDRGGGTAFTLVGEAWWNFGPILGPLLVGSAIGMLLALLARGTRRRPHGLCARLVPYLVPLVLGMHRSSAAASFKQLVSILVPVLCLTAAAHLSWLVLRSERRPLPRTTIRCAGSTDS